MKMFPAMVAAFLSLNAANAANGNCDNKCPERCCETSCKHVNGTCGPVLSPTGPVIDYNGWDIHVSALYEQVRVSGTEFAYSDIPTTGGIPISGSVLNVKGSMDWGFQVGVGYVTESDEWRLGANYMFFQSNSKKSASASFNNGYVPIDVVASLTSPVLTAVDTVSSNLKMTFNSLDLNMSRGAYMGCQFALTPMVGLKTAWIDFKQNTNYAGGSILVNDTVNVNERSKFWGIGPDAGFGSRYDFGRSGFLFYGDADVALLFGNHKLTNTQRFSANQSNDVFMRESVNNLSPVARLGLGFGYETFMCDCKQSLAVRAGLDVQYWWNQHLNFDISNSSPVQFSTSEDDFSLHGLLIDVDWHF